MDGRSKNGGARKGAGRKPKANEQELSDLLDRAWPLEKREAAIKKHAAKAQAGDVKSFGILMAYTFGKPIERKEITGAEGEPLLQPVADALTKIYAGSSTT